MQYEIKELSQQHIRFIEGVMQGKTLGDSYKKAGYKIKSIRQASRQGSRLMTSDLVKAEIARRQAEISEQNMNLLKHLQKTAVIGLGNLILSADEMVKFRACADVLDRTGLKPVENLNITESDRMILIMPASQAPGIEQVKVEEKE
jgi:phage terminase small subunit